MRRIEDLRWYYGAVLPEKLRNNMSIHEQNYLKGYSELLNRYMQKVGIDLTTVSAIRWIGISACAVVMFAYCVWQDLRPPKHLNVKVSVEEDCGEIMTYRGSVKLEKGAVLSLRRTDVDHLIRQGKLREIDQDNWAAKKRLKLLFSYEWRPLFFFSPHNNNMSLKQVLTLYRPVQQLFSHHPYFPSSPNSTSTADRLCIASLRTIIRLTFHCCCSFHKFDNNRPTIHFSLVKLLHRLFRITQRLKSYFSRSLGLS